MNIFQFQLKKIRKISFNAKMATLKDDHNFIEKERYYKERYYNVYYLANSSLTLAIASTVARISGCASMPLTMAAPSAPAARTSR